MHVAVVIIIKQVLIALKKNSSILTGRTKTVLLGTRKTKKTQHYASPHT